MGAFSENLCQMVLTLRAWGRTPSRLSAEVVKLTSVYDVCAGLAGRGRASRRARARWGVWGQREPPALFSTKKRLLPPRRPAPGQHPSPSVSIVEAGGGPLSPGSGLG